jgi:hypothetical protein
MSMPTRVRNPQGRIQHAVAPMSVRDMTLRCVALRRTSSAGRPAGQHRDRGVWPGLAFTDREHGSCWDWRDRSAGTDFVLVRRTNAVGDDRHLDPDWPHCLLRRPAARRGRVRHQRRRHRPPAGHRRSCRRVRPDLVAGRDADRLSPSGHRRPKHRYLRDRGRRRSCPEPERRRRSGRLGTGLVAGRGVGRLELLGRRPVRLRPGPSSSRTGRATRSSTPGYSWSTRPGHPMAAASPS